MRFGSCERGARQVPQDELAVLADRSESQSSVFGPPCVPRNARDPGAVPLAVRNNVLLERRVHRAEVVLPASLRNPSKSAAQPASGTRDLTNHNKPTVRTPRDTVDRAKVAGKDIQQPARGRVRQQTSTA